MLRKDVCICCFSLFVLSCAAKPHVVRIEPPPSTLMAEAPSEAKPTGATEPGIDESQKQTEREEDYVIRIERIESLAKDKQWTKALQETNTALARYPEESRLYLMKGTIFQRLGENRRALESYKIALSKNPAGREKIEDAIEQLNDIVTE